MAKPSIALALALAHTKGCISFPSITDALFTVDGVRAHPRAWCAREKTGTRRWLFVELDHARPLLCAYDPVAGTLYKEIWKHSHEQGPRASNAADMFSIVRSALQAPEMYSMRLLLLTGTKNGTMSERSATFDPDEWLITSLTGDPGQGFTFKATRL